MYTYARVLGVAGLGLPGRRCAISRLKGPGRHVRATSRRRRTRGRALASRAPGPVDCTPAPCATRPGAETRATIQFGLTQRKQEEEDLEERRRRGGKVIATVVFFVKPARPWAAV